MGLKIGIYSTPWVGTYAAHIGSYSDNPDGENQWIKDGMHNEHFRYQKPGGNYWKDRAETYRHAEYSFVKADVAQWVEWGIDYLKYDWLPNDRYYTAEMHDALENCGRDIVYSISNKAPYADAPLWMNLCNCWRTTSDIRDNWESVSSIGFAHDRWLPFTGPGLGRSRHAGRRRSVEYETAPDESHSRRTVHPHFIVVIAGRTAPHRV